MSKDILEKMSSFNYVLFHCIFQITQNSCKIPKVSKSKAEFVIRNSNSRIVSTSGLKMTNNGQNNAYLKMPRNRFWLGLHFDRPLQFGKSAQNRKRQRFWQGSFSRKNIKSLLELF